MSLYLYIKSHNCGTTGRNYENDLYSQNMFNMSTIMIDTQMGVFCRFTSPFAKKKSLIMEQKFGM
jgi:hypothetical protein